MIRRILIGWGALILSSVQAQIPSPFNQLIPVDTSDAAVSHFLVGAHFYGGSGNKAGFPASTLLGNLPAINASGADLLICNGDLFKDVKNDIPHYEQSLFRQLKLPLYNAVGNHDISGNTYQEHYGKTWQAFTWKEDRFILLDSEVDDSSISGEQLEFLKKELASEPVRRFFIFSHRPIWAEEDEVFSPLFKNNTRSIGNINYKSEVEPLLNKASDNKAIYWFSGSLGNVPVSFFHHKVADKPLFFIQTAIRDLPRDAILRVNSDPQKVAFETISLTGKKTEPLESYDLAYWQDFRPPVEFNYRLIPYYLKKTYTAPYFWYGFIHALVFVLMAGLWWKKRKRRSV